MDLILSTPCFVYVFAINICCCITVQITQLSLSINFTSRVYSPCGTAESSSWYYDSLALISSVKNKWMALPILPSLVPSKPSLVPNLPNLDCIWGLVTKLTSMRILKLLPNPKPSLQYMKTTHSVTALHQPLLVNEVLQELQCVGSGKLCLTLMCQHC